MNLVPQPEGGPPCDKNMMKRGAQQRHAAPFYLKALISSVLLFKNNKSKPFNFKLLLGKFEG